MVKEIINLIFQGVFLIGIILSMIVEDDGIIIDDLTEIGA